MTFQSLGAEVSFGSTRARTINFASVENLGKIGKVIVRVTRNN